MALAGLGISIVGLFFSWLQVPVLMLLSLPMAITGAIICALSLKKTKSVLAIIGIIVCAIITVIIATVWTCGICVICTIV